MARTRRPNPEGLPAGAGRPVSVGAARRVDVAVRGGVRGDRQGPSRDRRRPDRAVGAVLEAVGAGRRRLPDARWPSSGHAKDATRHRKNAVPSAARPPPTPAATSPGTAPRTCAPIGSAEAAAVGVTPASLESSIRSAVRHAPRFEFGTYQDLMAEMVERRSAWHRLDVLQAACDTTRPNPDFDGAGWVEVLERDVDVILQSCIDLDPTECDARGGGLVMAGRCGSNHRLGITPAPRSWCRRNAS